MSPDSDTVRDIRRAAARLGYEGLPLFPNGFTVLDPIEPGYSVRLPAPSVLAAGAVETVADDAENLYAQRVVEASDTYRLDGEAMEHTRQSRLIRWQRQPH